MSFVSIRDIASLEQLRVAIARFCDSCGNLAEIDSMLQARIGHLKNLESKFKLEIKSAKDDLRSAQSALRSCESNTYQDDEGNTIYPDCSFEQGEILDCQKSLQIAEHKFQIYKQQIHYIEKAVAEYQIPKLKFRNLIQFKKEAAVSSLKQLINGAEDYLSVSTPHCDSLAVSESGSSKAPTKADQTMAMGAATVGVVDLMFFSLFTFLGLSGKKYSISNSASNGIVTSSLTQANDVCSKLKIENKNGISYAKIISISIPSSLHQEESGRHLTQNMETICRANDCKEIAVWANSTNVDFYKKMGYEVRSEIKDTGAEVFKVFDSHFSDKQKKAKAAFTHINNADFIKSNDLGMQFVNPLDIIAPEEANDNKFWSQHGEDLERYLNLIEQYDQCTQLQKNGKTLDEIRKQDSWLANAHDIFSGKEPVKLQKVGDYYRIDGGRHRVAAAQIYYMRTGKIVPLVASAFERA